MEETHQQVDDHGRETCDFSLRENHMGAIDHITSEDTSRVYLRWAWNQPRTPLGERTLIRRGAITSEPKSRISSPEKTKRGGGGGGGGRRVNLPRIYTRHDSAKETRSEKYVFLHHGNWRQYMKQYRKYHTVGQAGRVTNEDLEWKNLLRHINFGETLRELLYNPSATLPVKHSISSMNHRCRETSMKATSSSPSVIGKDRSLSNPEKRNLFQSFNLASVNPKTERQPATQMKNNEPLSKRTQERSGEHGGLTPAGWVNGGRAMHAGQIAKLVEDERDCSRERNTYKDQYQKIRSNREHGDQKKIGRFQTDQIVSNQTASKMKARCSDEVGSLDKSRDLEVVLPVVRSYRRNDFLQKGIRFKMFNTVGLGSLKTGNHSATGYANHRDRKEIIKKLRRKSAQQDHLARDLKTNTVSRFNSKKTPKSLYQTGNDNGPQFSITSYEGLRKVHEIKLANAGDTGSDTPRTMAPLSVQTVICGNQYGTAADHERRFTSSVVP